MIWYGIGDNIPPSFSLVAILGTPQCQRDKYPREMQQEGQYMPACQYI